MYSTLARAVLALALFASAQSLYAESPVLVKDIWPGTSGSIYEPTEPSSAGTAAGVAFVASAFSLRGLSCGGLWVTDGTGPLRIAYDGLCVSGRGVEFNGALFFAASDEIGGGLWKSDGTPGGTRLVKRPAGGDQRFPAGIRRLTAGAGKLFFAAEDGVHGMELWASDGTEAGTAMVADATPGPTGTLDTSTSIFGGASAVFFTSCTGSCRLWTSDGTSAGTVPLADEQTSSFATIGTTLYFLANGQALWKSDGTPAGTLKVVDAPNGAELTAVGGTLFFRACDSTNGCELWKSDGTAPGTAIVKDVTPGNGGDVWALVAFGNALLFQSPGLSSFGLWRSDGTEAGTTQLATPSGQPLTSVVAGAKFFLLTNSQLWVSDGSPGGTTVVSDFPVQPPSGVGPYPGVQMLALGDVVVFGVQDAVGVGIYRSDGSAAGTRPLGPLLPWANSSAPGRLTDANGTLFFGADDGVHGFELWTSNGTPESTRLVKDINAGPDGFNLSPLVPVGGGVFFTVFTPAAGNELWRSDGTEAGTYLVKDIAPGTASSSPGPVGTRGDLLLFNAATEEGGPRALWRTDGTDAGTFSLGGVLSNSRFADWRGTAYFLGSYQGVDALWKTDGSIPGTSAVAVLGGGSQGGIAVVRDTLVFFACDAAHGCEPWKSDGTAAGTALLLDVNPGAATNFSVDFLPVADVAMFWADDGVHGREPWVTDGTQAGTRLLADVLPGPASSIGIGTAAAGGLRFFPANDGTHGFELWKTDGTPAGTALVADINPGPMSAFRFSSFTAGFRDVWFFASDGLTGEELWRSDGTAAGTFRVADLFPGPASSTIHPVYGGFDRLRRSGARMFFVADDGTTGFELWSAPIATTMHVLSPCRLYDSRLAAGAALADGEVRRFTAAGACGIPPGAAQLVANVTVVGATADGSVEVGPGGPVWTGLGAVTFGTGRTRANNAIFAIGNDGSAAAKVSAPGGSAHLVVDVFGYLQ